jgi:hypothetical protein
MNAEHSTSKSNLEPMRASSLSAGNKAREIGDRVSTIDERSTAATAPNAEATIRDLIMKEKDKK